MSTQKVKRKVDTEKRFSLILSGGMGPQVLSDTVDVVEVEEEHSSSDSTPGEEPKCRTCGDNKDKPIIMKAKCRDCGCRKCGDTDESKG